MVDIAAQKEEEKDCVVGSLPISLKFKKILKSL